MRLYQHTIWKSIFFTKLPHTEKVVFLSSFLWIPSRNRRKLFFENTKISKLAWFFLSPTSWYRGCHWSPDLFFLPIYYHRKTEKNIFFNFKMNNLFLLLWKLVLHTKLTIPFDWKFSLDFKNFLNWPLKAQIFKKSL